MQPHSADMRAEKTPRKPGQWLYEQRGSRKRAMAGSSLRSWWVTIGALLMESVEVTEMPASLNINRASLGGACVTGWWGKASLWSKVPFLQLLLCKPHRLPLVSCYESLINNGHIKLLLETIDYAPLWGTLPREVAALYASPTVIIRVLWIISNQEGEGPTTSCRFGISHTIDWIILISVFATKTGNLATQGKQVNLSTFLHSVRQSPPGVAAASSLGLAFHALQGNSSFLATLSINLSKAWGCSTLYFILRF